jgi:hypothetical protein
MGRRFTIEVGNAVAVCELLEEEAPSICQAFWDNLPVTGFTMNAKFAGQELIVMLPFFAEPENEILDVVAGDIGYYPGRQTACIFYGETMPFGKVSVYAKVVEGLERLVSIGDDVIARGSMAIALRRA